MSNKNCEQTVDKRVKTVILCNNSHSD